MGGFGSIWHWVIVLLVIVLLFGAKRIPELAKGLGSGIKNFKKAVRDEEDEEAKELPQDSKMAQESKKPKAISGTSTKTDKKKISGTEKKATKTTASKTTKTKKIKES